MRKLIRQMGDAYVVLDSSEFCRIVSESDLTAEELEAFTK